MKNIMENKDGKLYNTMGSVVAEGFTCKPKHFDANKPIMHLKTQLFVCTDERCGKAHKDKDIAATLREAIKEVNLSKGEDRIKVVRTGCFGACRFRSVANIYENTKVNGNSGNNGVWLKNVHRYDKDKWKRLFIALKDNVSIDSLDEFEQVPMSDPSFYK
ncbi:hypothetical protein CRU98_00365 [Arcobacter sp. CECT 8986]|nr:hypothetical protein CRU98_00365 [Arcobacter sp. CECT 8986]